MVNNPIHTFVVLAYKESEHLEDCIKSVLNQKHRSKVIIATTTTNQYIIDISKKYNLVIKEGTHKNIGSDFDFAKNSANTELVTIAHQDDIYDKNYSHEITEAYNKYKDSSIIFSDYYEIRANKVLSSNLNLKIKRILLMPARIVKLSNKKFIKRQLLRFGNAICCPSVTFVSNQIPKSLFSSKYEANVDWFAWEKLSKLPGRFTFVNKKLMGHRISAETETTKIINSGQRTKEDFEIFNKFWPKIISRILTKIYKNSEVSNSE